MILWLTCTHGRYKCLQRNLRCYLDQKFPLPSVMFICNSGSPLKLPDDFKMPFNKNIYIDNCGLCNFQSVGEKYTHAVRLALQQFPAITIVCSADDDDIFLPNHLHEGYKGMKNAYRQDLLAYKPQRSYYRYRDANTNIVVTQAENTLEPSIFVDAFWLENHGYAPVSVRYHQQWLDPLIYENKLLIDPEGRPTLVYNWGDNGDPDGNFNIYKMSGSGQDNQQNFIAHTRVSKDMGNGVLTPTDSNQVYYDQVTSSLKSMEN